MNIKNFDRLRVESADYCFLDISKIGMISQEGCMATAYMMKSNKDWIKQKVEVRKKDNMITLITYHYGDSEIPEYWRDAEILFSRKQVEGRESIPKEDTKDGI